MNDISLVKSHLRLQSWAAMARDCQQSGLTVEAWCKSQGLKTKTYYYRLRRVRAAALASVSSGQISASDESEKSCFRKLQVQTPAMNMTSAVTVHFPNATIEVSNDATQRTIEAVLLALKSTC